MNEKKNGVATRVLAQIGVSVASITIAIFIFEFAREKWETYADTKIETQATKLKTIEELVKANGQGITEIRESLLAAGIIQPTNPPARLGRLGKSPP